MYHGIQNSATPIISTKLFLFRQSNNQSNENTFFRSAWVWISIFIILHELTKAQFRFLNLFFLSYATFLLLKKQNTKTYYYTNELTRNKIKKIVLFSVIKVAFIVFVVSNTRGGGILSSNEINNFEKNVRLFLHIPEA